MPDPCPHEATIKQTHKELFGNGKDGLSKEFAVLKSKFEDMTDDVKKLATSYSALAQSQVKHDAIEKQKVENRKRLTDVVQRLGTIFAIVFGLIGVLYLILDHVN